jgi:hypothetical protein
METSCWAKTNGQAAQVEWTPTTPSHSTASITELPDCVHHPNEACYIPNYLVFKKQMLLYQSYLLSWIRF